jgi:putative colanic acid biosynthesis acetyltransferase WcaB
MQDRAMPKQSLIKTICEDFRYNTHFKSKFILLLFRIANYSGTSSSQLIYYTFFPFRFFYRLVVDWVLGVDIPWRTTIGRRPILFHSFGLVINEGALLGDDCVLRHSVTIGNKMLKNKETRAPRVGNNVEFGAGCIVIGDVTIEDDAIIGAGAVVTKNVHKSMIMIGNPAREVRKENA